MLLTPRALEAPKAPASASSLTSGTSLGSSVEEPGAETHSLSQAIWSPLSHTQEDVGASAACCLATALESWSPLRPKDSHRTVMEFWSPPPPAETQQEQPKELPSPVQEVQSVLEAGLFNSGPDAEEGQECTGAAAASVV